MERLDAVAAYFGSIVPYLPGFLKSCVVVVELTMATILLSWACGLIAALGKLSPYRLFRWPAEFYVWFIRGTPTLVQIFIVYFGFPQLGLGMSPFVAGVLALGVNSGSYVAEIVRAGILAIPRGQFESATALGMSYFQAMRRIILPQVVRIVLPPITNEASTMLKNTSLVSTITVVELTLHTQILIAATFRPFEFYMVAAVLYLLLTTVLTSASAALEKRFALKY